MEQNADTGTPVTPTMDDKQKSGNGLKIATTIACVIAVCGIGFGIYGMMQSFQKDNQISDLKVQVESKDGTIAELETDKIEINNDTNTITITDDAIVADNLHLIGDLYTKRRYYLGITDLDPSKDSREVETYLVDTTKLGSKDGISKYDIKAILDKIADEKVASLPDTLAAGTVNARPKSSCQSFRVRVGDVTDNPKNINWTSKIDWTSLLPITVYMECIVNDGSTISQSLGTDMYSLNPQTGETVKLIENWY